MPNSEKEVVVIYHSDCPDGFSAAYVAWKKFGDTATYVPVFPGEKLVQGLSGKKVYTIDFCYPLDIMRELVKIAEVVVIDHHISNADSVKLASESLFDITHSGSVLAWKYFFPEQEVPVLLRYVEENDLWTYNLPSSKEVTQSLNLRSFDFQVWDNLVSDFEDEEKRNIYIREGEILIKKMDKVVADLVKDSYLAEFEGYQCLVVNSSVYISQVGHVLSRKNPPVGVIWSVRGGRVTVSLRSDGTVDVSKLAGKYNGGGHKAAAGFILPNLAEVDKVFKPVGLVSGI
ncbi:MAG: DHHA1 domain-containing protein [bacterium]